MHSDGREMVVESSREHRDRFLVKFAGSESRADAELLRGELFVLPGDVREITALVERVALAGFGNLVVTVDSQVAPNRENYLRAGFSAPLRPTLRLAWDGITRPRWLCGTFLRTLIRHGMPHFENNFATRGAPILSPSVVREW